MNKIGVFDSGFGGLTIFKDIVKLMPHYNYIYLGDNSRAPYGTKSFDTVYEYTWQCVHWLIQQNCSLIILACNTASARALRSIQQNELKQFPHVRVLGVIRPTVEVISHYTHNNHIGILATPGTVKSNTYQIEIENLAPHITVYQHACNLWVPFIEDNYISTQEFESIVKADIDILLAQSPLIDTILLGCTHYPIIEDIIRKFVPTNIKIINQGSIVANSLQEYLYRHKEIENLLEQSDCQTIYTTDDVETFNQKATLFFGQPLFARKAKVQTL